MKKLPTLLILTSVIFFIVYASYGLSYGAGPGGDSGDPGPQGDGGVGVGGFDPSGGYGYSGGPYCGNGYCGDPSSTCITWSESCMCMDWGCGCANYCSAYAPEDCNNCPQDCGSCCASNIGQSCGSCGGTIQCNGACSVSTPSNYGSPCGNGGSILCSGSCSNPCAGNTGSPCGSCGGTIQCNGACSVSTPSNYGQSCGSCGGTIQCNGACSVSTPSNYGSSCGNCGTIGCSGSCINQGPCSPGQTTCSGDTTQVCSSGCQWQSQQYCPSFSGWVGGGNTQTATCGVRDNDASSEYRDYHCSAGSCTYSVTQTKNCDSSDGWYGGGNNAGCGTDPNSVWNDYYVIPNTGSCTSTTTCTGTNTFNCDSQDICNNKCEGNIFTSVPPMKDYYVAPNTNSCTSTTDSPVTEDCATKQSTDTDSSATAYTVPGTVTDYTSCTLSGCASTQYSDSCSGNVLTEYGASGSSITSGTKNCADYNTFYCSNNKYFQQNWGCSGTPGYCNDAAVADMPVGTDADNDGVDVQCGDTTCDNAPGVCDAAVAGKCIGKTATETNCADGLDNDCNGLTDCADPACGGSISGTVRNQNAQPVSGADVSVKKDLTTIKSTTTSSQGTYTLSSINCGGTYNMVASHPDYVPNTQSIALSPTQQATLNFNMNAGTSCEPDCTYANDNIVHATCDGKNGCTFYDAISKAACDNSQPGWVRDYNSTYYVICASGSPQPKVEVQASVSCASGTLVKVTRIVVYNGEPVKLVVAACG